MNKIATELHCYIDLCISTKSENVVTDKGRGYLCICIKINIVTQVTHVTHVVHITLLYKGTL